MDTEDNLKLFTKLYKSDFDSISKIMEDSLMKKKLKKPIPQKEEKPKSSFDVFKDFYEPYFEKMCETSARYVASYQDITTYITDKSKSLVQIRDYLGTFSTVYLSDVDKYSSSSNNPVPPESVFESIIKIYSSIEFVTDEAIDAGLKDLPRISFKLPISMKYVSLEDNDAWEFTPEPQIISIIFNTLGTAKYINTLLKHPCIPRSQNLISVPSVITKRKMDNNYILGVIDDIVNYFTKYNPKNLAQSIELFIGKKCSICSCRDKTVVFGCAESGLPIHKTCGKEFNGSLYNPKFIKTCSSCSQENLFWVIKSGNVICEKCNNE